MLQAIRRRLDDDKGFTLIELMVVVLIIAILIAIALPTFLGARTRAQNRSAQSDLRNALTAAKVFYTDGDTYTGFNAAQGTTLEGALTWADGVAAVNAGTVHVDTANISSSQVQMLTRSDSDTYYCIRENVSGANAGTHYGDGATIAAAQGDCGSAAW